jgi:16S rRNA (cytosine967-C5)-methyltransferase
VNAARSVAAAKVAPARRCAYAVLRRVFEHGAYADLALHSQARTLDARDRALAMRLAYGAVQRRGTLDHLTEALAARPLARLDAPLLAALRLGLYELLYLRGAPDHAVVADAVELAKTSGRAGHGLVNAVLRRAAREGPALLRALDDRTPEHAAIMHSHPEWIARLWWDELGAEEARALMAADNEPGEVALRVNTLAGAVDVAGTPSDTPGANASSSSPGRLDVPVHVAAIARELPVPTHTDPRLPEALVLDGPFDLHASPLWRAGVLVAQSRAAMLVARAVDPRPGERVLDLCAAPGGKSTHLAALMEGRGEVVAVERDRRRAADLQRTAQRLHAGSVRVELADAAIPRVQEAPFDRVLVDPPCSGLGTLQARADLRWRVTPEHVRELAGVQAAILAAGAAAVRPGGVLVYSTCTISQAENERQIAAFLDARPDFALAAEGPVMTLPHRDHTAGFFIARMRRS